MSEDLECSFPSDNETYKIVNLISQMLMTLFILIIAVLRFINTRSQLNKNKSDEVINSEAIRLKKLKNIYYSLKTKSLSENSN